MGKSMNFIKTAIDGVVIIEPRVFADARGYFMETYNEAEFIKNGITNKFVQDISLCRRMVLCAVCIVKWVRMPRRN